MSAREQPLEREKGHIFAHLVQIEMPPIKKLIQSLRFLVQPEVRCIPLLRGFLFTCGRKVNRIALVGLEEDVSFIPLVHLLGGWKKTSRLASARACR